MKCLKQTCSKLALLVLILLCSWGTTVAGTMEFLLECGPYQIQKDAQDHDFIDMKDFVPGGSAGNPMLPHRIYNIAVPPDIIWSSLNFKIIDTEMEQLEGTYDIKPAPPAATWVDAEQIIEWGKGKVIVDNKNIAIYGNDADFPERFLRLLPYSQMRKWKFTKLDFTPFRYNPITKRLTLIRKVVIEISFQQSGEKLEGIQMRDKVFDDMAKRKFFNYEHAKGWYIKKVNRFPGQPTYDYVIITTNAIKNNSSKLDAFIAHKENLGHTVKLVTEDDIAGVVGQPPNGIAEKIREWLKDNYVSMGIEYVLLIGNPDPDDPDDPWDSVGDVPMKMCWPRRGETNYREGPTDYFYADLTGNWDLNGDQIFGDYRYDRGPGGVDFSPEVYVGRIPVYGADYTQLDDILQKIIDYELEGSIGWRKSVLLPESFSDSSTDGARLAERMIDNYLESSGYSYYTLYQHKTTGCYSIYTSDEDLVNGAVKSHWQDNPYGIVTWWGHGNQTGAYIGYGGVCSDGLILSISDCTVLNDDYPAFTYQCSCLNGYPEATNNLGYSLLKNGAIATVSATRVSWYAVGWNGPYTSYADNASIGYYYDEKLVNWCSCGMSLYETMASMGNAWEAESWMNKMVFNIYGDPTTAISVEPIVSIDLLPDATVIPRGETLGYAVTATNNTDSTQIFQYWTNVTLPNGNTYPPSGTLFGPYTVTLSPYGSRTGDLSHGIPLTAPLGDYTYNAFVGPYPTIWDEDHFDFEVTGPTSKIGAEHWQTTIDQF